MNTKFTLLAVAILCVGLMTNAYAHKSEIIGEYKVEIGWDKEPPIAGMDNKIIVIITHASVEEIAAAEETDHDEMTHNEMDDEKHEETEHEDHEEAEHEQKEGISGLASSIDVTVTLNGEKTALTMVEDEETHGLYVGGFTPLEAGFPTVHLFVEIDGEPLEIDMHPEKIEDGAMIKTATSDASINVDVITTAPTADKEMLIKVEFIDAQGSPLEHVNYDIIALQNGNQILSESGEHAHEGAAQYSTEALSSSDPVDVQVKILGIGLPDDEANWSGPMGETISINVVPEFGPIAMIVLATSIISIVVAARSKIISRFSQL